MNKELKEQLELISWTIAKGQGLLELNDFDDLEEREEEFELGFEALVKVEAYIKELEEKIDHAPSEEDVLANKGMDLNY